MVRRQVAVLGAASERELNAILRCRHITGAAADLIRGRVDEFQVGVNGDDDSDRPSRESASAQITGRERAQAALVEGLLRERLLLGAEQAAKHFGYPKAFIPIAKLCIVMLDRLVSVPRDVPPYGSGSTHVLSTKGGACRGVYRSLENLSSRRVPANAAIFSSVYWASLEREGKDFVRIANQPKAFYLKSMRGFSAERAKTAFPAACTDWAKPQIRVAHGEMFFSLSPHARTTSESPLSIEISQLLPLPWRFALVQRVIEIFAGLEQKAWFIPVGEAAEWCEFFNHQVVSAIEVSEGELFPAEETLFNYNAGVEIITQALQGADVSVPLMGECMINPDQLLPTEDDERQARAQRVKERVGSVR